MTPTSNPLPPPPTSNPLPPSSTAEPVTTTLTAPHVSSTQSVDTPKRLRPARRPPLVPPLSFQLAATGVYRSGYPLEINFPMLSRLRLKTVIYLASDLPSPEYLAFLASHSIKLHHFPVQPVREPFIANDPVTLTAALHIIADKRNHPVLVHSNKGKHRAGVLVGVMRVCLQRWSLASAQNEYGRFAGGKGEADLEFIEIFRPELNIDERYKPDWVRI